MARFVKLAGGASGKIAILGTASALGDEIVDLYRLIFTELGVPHVVGLRPVTRAEANDPDTAAAIDDVTGVFMTGGNQVKLSTVLAGTRAGRAILHAHQRGAVVGGTSAGASAICTHMVAFGASGDIPKQRMGQLSAGLGLLSGVIIDQHFAQRNRIGRLLALVAHSPSHLGLGLDEDTAAIIHSDEILDVVGRGVVLIADGAHVESNAYEAKRTQPLMVSGVVLHALPEGYSFNIASRRLLPRIEPKPRIAKVARLDQRTIDRVAAEGADDTVVERSERRKRAREASE